MVRASINAQNLRVRFTLIHSKSYNSILTHAIPVNQPSCYSVYIGDRDGTVTKNWTPYFRSPRSQIFGPPGTKMFEIYGPPMKYFIPLQKLLLTSLACI